MQIMFRHFNTIFELLRIYILYLNQMLWKESQKILYYKKLSQVNFVGNF